MTPQPSSRPSIDQTYMDMVAVLARRGSCARRKVSCILTNRKNQVLATGYNGPAYGVDNCTETPCPGTTFSSGLGLDNCVAVHAEQNALLQCRDVDQVWTAYCSVSPCVTCVKLLMNTSCFRIVFAEPYSHLDAQLHWLGLGRDWCQYDAPTALAEAEHYVARSRDLSDVRLR